jgi:transcriptional regulator with XRE-family HTH domain
VAREHILRWFGENLRRARLRLRMTQAEVANIGIVTERHYQKLENGEVCPRLNVAAALARALDLSLDRAIVKLERDPVEEQRLAEIERSLRRPRPTATRLALIRAAEARAADLLPKRKPRSKAVDRGNR